MNQNTIANGRDASGRDGNGLAALLETTHRHNLALIDLVGQWSDYRAGKRDMPETDLATALTPASSNDNAANTVLGKIVKSALRCGYGNIPKTHWLDDARMSTRKLIKAIAALHGTDFIPDMRQHADAFYALLEDTARDDVTPKQFKKELEDRVWFFVKVCTKNANELDKFLLNVQPVPHEQNLVDDVIPLLDALPDAVRDGRISGEDLLRLAAALRSAIDAIPRPEADPEKPKGKTKGKAESTTGKKRGPKQTDMMRDERQAVFKYVTEECRRDISTCTQADVTNVWNHPKNISRFTRAAGREDGQRGYRTKKALYNAIMKQVAEGMLTDA